MKKAIENIRRRLSNCKALYKDAVEHNDRKAKWHAEGMIEAYELALQAIRNDMD